MFIRHSSIPESAILKLDPESIEIGGHKNLNRITAFPYKYIYALLQKKRKEKEFKIKAIT